MKKKRTEQEPKKPVSDDAAANSFLQKLVVGSKKGILDKKEAAVIKQQVGAHRILNNASAVLDDAEKYVKDVTALINSSNYFTMLSELPPPSRAGRIYGDFMSPVMRKSMIENPNLINLNDEDFEKVLKSEEVFKKNENRGVVKNQNKIECYMDVLGVGKCDPEDDAFMSFIGFQIKNLFGTATVIVSPLVQPDIDGQFIAQGTMYRNDFEDLKPDYRYHSRSLSALTALEEMYADRKYGTITPDLETGPRRLRLLWGRAVIYGGSFKAVVTESIRILTAKNAVMRARIDNIRKMMDAQIESGKVMRIPNGDSSGPRIGRF